MKYDNIKAIEAITEETAAAIAEQIIPIKGHNVYFVDFGAPFGLSALVFAEKEHIYHANDYELHYANKTKKELRARFIQKLTKKLFTEEELLKPSRNYEEAERKESFLRNYYTMRRPYITAFQITRTKEEEKAFYNSIKGYAYNPVGFCYQKDKNFIKKCCDLLTALTVQREKEEKEPDYLENAILYEMENHEYCYNWQGDFDICNKLFGCVWIDDTATYKEYLLAAGEPGLIPIYKRALDRYYEKAAF